MHMADALISPIVGGTLWLVSGGLLGYSAKKITEEGDGSKTSLMGVLGAFIFAAQMINFTIPGTGSSGHFGGGLLLAILLGRYRAFLTLSSVLIIQALFFADGGLLALGCNMLNLAFFPAFIAYPFIYRVIAGTSLSPGRLAAGSMTAAIIGLLMGAFFVVLETRLSGITELPFTTFLLFMLPIHLAIGIVEGLVTWSVVVFVARTEPALFMPAKKAARPRLMPTLFMTMALMTAGVLSWFASSRPDGLEWSVARASVTGELRATREPLHEIVSALQQKITLLPDYGFKPASGSREVAASPLNAATTLSGIVGSLSVLVVAGTAALVLGRKPSEPKQS